MHKALSRLRKLFVAVALFAASIPAIAQPVEPRAEIGVGLEGLADWSPAQMFADIMKTSRPWGLPDQPWRNEGTVRTDALGWPLQDAGVVIAADTIGLGGTYKLSFTGRATVRSPGNRARIENPRFTAGTNTSTADVVVPEGASEIMLAFVDTAGGVRDVRMMRPGTTEKDTFTKPFLNKVAPFSTLRFMDILSTNNNPVKTWTERTTPAHATQARQQGAALEYVMALANETGKDIWVNVPDQADDDYIRHMAQLLKDGLTKKQKVYVEWSNEVWNWGFRQAVRNLDAAKAESKVPGSPLAFDGDTNEGYWAMRRIALRTVQVGQIFRDVFAATDFSRVRPIYCTQVGYEEVYKQGLGFLEHQYTAPNTVIYAIAGAPYFQVSDALNAKKDLTVDEIFAGIPDNINRSLDYAATLSAYARFYNLPFLAYEGGQHLQDHGDVGNAAAKVRANLDGRMGEAIEQYLDGWNALGGGLFMYFTLSSGYSKWGSWGLVNDITKTSPKYEAVLRVLARPRAPLTLGTPVGEPISAGDFRGSNRWDKRGVASVTIEPGKWMQYVVRAPEAGTYRLSVSITGGEGTADVIVGGTTSSLQDPVNLKAGLNVFRVAGRTGRFQMKGLSIGRAQ